MQFIDLKSKTLQSHTCASPRKEMADEFRKDGVLSTDGLFCPHTSSASVWIATTATTRVKSFSCWDQFLSMAFAQLTYRESLRDIETCLRAAGEKLYHMGIRGKVSRNTLAHANRGARLENLPRLCPSADPTTPENFIETILSGLNSIKPPMRLDSTIVDLCLSLFPGRSSASAKPP